MRKLHTYVHAIYRVSRGGKAVSRVSVRLFVCLFVCFYLLTD